MGLHAGAGTGSARIGEGAVVKQAGHRRGQCPGVTRRDGQAGLAIAVDDRHARRQGRGDHRLATRHRLKLHQSEPFGGSRRRQHEDVARVVDRWQVRLRHIANEAHAVGNAKAGGLVLQGLAVPSLPGNHQGGIGPRHRVKQYRDTLVIDQPAQEEDHPVRIAPRRAPSPTRLDGRWVEIGIHVHTGRDHVAFLRDSGQDR